MMKAPEKALPSRFPELTHPMPAFMDVGDIPAFMSSAVQIVSASAWLFVLNEKTGSDICLIIDFAGINSILRLITSGIPLSWEIARLMNWVLISLSVYGLVSRSAPDICSETIGVEQSRLLVKRDARILTE